MRIHRFTSRVFQSAFAAVLFVFVLVASTAIVQAQTLDQAIILHDSARAGDGGDRDAALAMLQQLHADDPENAQVAAYLGSVYAITARDGRNVVSKMRNTNRALSHLDLALELGPDDFAVRMVRAMVQSNLPVMFSRKDDAIEDMLVLDDMFQAQQSPPELMSEAMVPIYDFLLEEAPDRGNWAEARARAANR